jgi:hypothetical protein
MIGRLIRAAAMTFVAFCVGTLIAEAILFTYVWSKWEMNGEKARQMLAVAQGYDLVAMRDHAALEQETTSVEQPSLAQIIEARAMKSRNLELREQALGQAMARLRLDQKKQAENVARFDETQKTFETRLASMTQTEKLSGFEQNIAILQNMNAKQAKEQLLRMYDSKEIDAVVRLMAGMAPSKRKKISNEFHTPEENEKLAEILRRIREGYPLAAMAGEAQQELQQPNKTAR